MKLKRGLVQVYTGNGKGKTTAAWGQAMRASGQGLRVAIIQFFKGKGSGEVKIAKKLNLKVHSFCPVHPFFGGKKKRLEKECQEGLTFAKKTIMSKKYDLIILDEINIALRDRLIEINEVLDLIKKKPKGVELILTGRGAPKKIIETANLVTEMREINHPYKKGIKGRRGIEY
ncbi:MAG TPA: cob(I)yrinic acid a,c-diamide adenosyltransferase [bacterium]|nr:cob(I)yrinic acid a,c-diamide adenosyltransferase [bacterium]